MGANGIILDHELSDIVIFGGSLKELNDRHKGRYEIAADFYQSYLMIPESSVFEYLKHNLRADGYDGLVRAQYHSDRILFFIRCAFITGVPIKKISE